MLALLARIEEHARKVAGLQCEEIAAGPFRALIHPTSDVSWFSYAVPYGPLDDAAGVDEHLQDLRRLFHARERTFRFEFTESLWPTLPGVLERAGMVLEARHPLMLCTPDDLRLVKAEGVAVRYITEADDLGAYRALIRVGFGGGPGPGSEQEAIEVRDALRQGMCYALATLDGTPAGAGGYLPLDGLCELVAITTLPAMRRRGVAATLSSFLAQDHFAHGGELAWLSAADEGAQAVYRRIGFRNVGARLNYTESTG